MIPQSILSLLKEQPIKALPRKALLLHLKLLSRPSHSKLRPSRSRPSKLSRSKPRHSKHSRSRPR